LPVADPTQRFSGRVESYRLHRPGYPAAIVDLLARECDLSSDSRIVDIAAGTGLLTEIFLAGGFEVTGVEPNKQMRAACATLTLLYPLLECVDGTAEATGLADNSVDLITVGQAMHWFDLKRTRSEFARILKPAGSCAVIYNNRRMAGDPFHEGYERILVECGSDYGKAQPHDRGSTRCFLRAERIEIRDACEFTATDTRSPAGESSLIVLHAETRTFALLRDDSRH
jgi:SAM-dependent methyltransferase